MPLLPLLLALPPAEATEIVVAAGVLQRHDETGQDVSVLDRATIEQRQTVQLSDLLATLPGVSVTRNGGPGGFTAVRLRGAEGEQTLTIIDGIRVNDPSSPGGGFDFANLLAGAIERVEVLRGADSVPWGSQAIGGVVNIVTAAPGAPFRARGAVEYGGYKSLSANAGISGRSGILAASLSGGVLHSRGVSAAANGAEADGYRQEGLTGRAEATLPAGFALQIGGYWAHSRAERDGYPAPAYVLADDGEYGVTREAYGYAALRSRLADGRLEQRVAVTLADIHRDDFDPAAGAGPAFTARGSSTRYEYRGSFEPVRALRLIAGAEHQDSRMSDGTDRFATAVTSVFAEAVASPVEAVTLTMGARHDQHRDYGSHWTFAANGALRPRAGTTLRASYAEGFKAPTLYQLFAPFYGTRTLRPESAASYDLGVEQRIGPARLSATWFHRDTTDQIDFDLTSFTYRNIAAARAEGVEFDAEVRARGVTLAANYTHLKAENRAPGGNYGHDLQRRPRDSGSVSLDVAAARGVSLGATVLAVGDSFDDPGNAVRLGGYVTASVRGEAEVARGIALYGRVENLFDRRYQTVAGYGQPARAAYLGVRVRTA